MKEMESFVRSVVDEFDEEELLNCWGTECSVWDSKRDRMKKWKKDHSIRFIDDRTRFFSFSSLDHLLLSRYVLFSCCNLFPASSFTPLSFSSYYRLMASLVSSITTLTNLFFSLLLLLLLHFQFLPKGGNRRKEGPGIELLLEITWTTWRVLHHKQQHHHCNHRRTLVLQQSSAFFIPWVAHEAFLNDFWIPVQLNNSYHSFRPTFWLWDKHNNTIITMIPCRNKRPHDFVSSVA